METFVNCASYALSINKPSSNASNKTCKALGTKKTYAQNNGCVDHHSRGKFLAWE